MDFLQSINWSVPSWDLFIVIFFVIAVFLYGISLGRDRIIFILISLYMALAVINTAPYLSSWSSKVVNVNVGDFAFKATLFLGIFVFLFFLLSKSALSSTFGEVSAGGKWWQVIIFSFLHVGLLISIILSFLPNGITDHLLSTTRHVFISDPGKFFWLIMPIGAMILFNRRSEEE